MFHTSSQQNHWMFKDEESLKQKRLETNTDFTSIHGASFPSSERAQKFLTSDEERLILAVYEERLRDFCKKFKPTMPPSVIGTAFHYFKRFYVINSVMDFHPKEILVTCVYLAAKVDEFNISIHHFVANVRGDKEKASDIILNNELLLMQQLGYHLTIHNPFRPIEGLMIDIKTRYPQLESPERLRPYIDEFLEKYYFTDVYMIYSPSQIALAAIIHAVSSVKENLDTYVTDVLLAKDKDKLLVLVSAIRNIRRMIRDVTPPPKDSIKHLEQKLEECRNQANNPNSEIYKRRILEALEDDDERQMRKHARIADEVRRMDAESLGGVQPISSPSL